MWEVLICLPYGTHFSFTLVSYSIFFGVIYKFSNAFPWFIVQSLIRSNLEISSLEFLMVCVCGSTSLASYTIEVFVIGSYFHR